MTEQSTATAERPGWTVEAFEGFWSNPDPALVPGVLTEDVVGQVLPLRSHFHQIRETPYWSKIASALMIAVLSTSAWATT